MNSALAPVTLRRAVEGDAETLVPMLVVLDGLDEVGQVRNRARIVTEIDEFASRLGRGAVMPQLVVTTRPSASGLPRARSNSSPAGTRILRRAYLYKFATNSASAGDVTHAPIETATAAGSGPSGSHGGSANGCVTRHHLSPHRTADYKAVRPTYFRWGAGRTGRSDGR